MVNYWYQMYNDLRSVWLQTLFLESTCQCQRINEMRHDSTHIASWLMVIFSDSGILLNYISFQGKLAPVTSFYGREKHKFSRWRSGSSGFSSWIWYGILVHMLNSLRLGTMRKYKWITKLLFKSTWFFWYIFKGENRCSRTWEDGHDSASVLPSNFWGKARSSGTLLPASLSLTSKPKMPRYELGCGNSSPPNALTDLWGGGSFTK